MKMENFHRVSAAKIKAFDMEMSNLRFDYQILPDGGVSLKNAALNACCSQYVFLEFTQKYQPVGLLPFVLSSVFGNTPCSYR